MSTQSNWKKCVYTVCGSMLALALLLGPGGEAAHAQSPTIDLNADRNRDGIPDGLAAAVNNVATAKDQMAAIQDLVSRLPYSDETRALQAKAESLQKALTEETDDATAQTIQKELQSVTDQMQADDPNYAKVDAALQQMFAPQLTQKSNAARPADPEGGNTQTSTQGDNTTQHACFNCLWRGDIMLERDPLFLGNFIYAMWYSHAGNYDGGGMVYESRADGVRLNPLAHWQAPQLYVALGFDNQRPASQTQAALNWAENTYGTDGHTPYNYYLWDKQTDRRLYCSQLTWKIHQHMGVELDSNHWIYQLWIGAHWGAWAVPLVSIPAVAPDEVALSSNVTFYSSGWNFLP